MRLLEYDEEDLERVLVLEEAEKLKTLAKAFLHPEAFVTVNGTATARCYFDRNSANAQENVESTDDRNAIMEDMKNLRAAASFYLHPEHGVITTDSTTCGRNYFSRPSSVAQENVDDAGERAQILADAVALKKLAVDYAHPELGVITTDPATCGRNYFSRPSSVAQENVNDAGERAQILADAVALKKLAVDYAHPELGVITTDPAACGRNYFSRPSSVAQADVDDTRERAQILTDAASLKKLAVDYAHPEFGVINTDFTTCGRNYFSRPSSIAQEDVDVEGRAQILADAITLKKLAVDYAHPELGVLTTDPATYGRNYFSRPSSVAQDEDGISDERAQILADAAAFKKLAVDYAHPELGVSTTDVTAFGRNFFSRPSTVTQDVDDAEERALILADAIALKKLAVDYAHPELGVVTTDSTTLNRNYFSRLSAVEEECKADAEERAQILADAAALKRLAVDYAHPEYGVSTTDATVFGRNYFTMRSIGEPLEALNVNKSRTQKKYLMKSKIEDKQPVKSKLSGGKNDLHSKLSEIITSHVKRSPSTVILFGLGDDDGSAY